MAGYADLFAAMPIPWLTKARNAQKFWASWAQLLDDSANALKEATTASFPTYAPDDALPHLSLDIGLLQGAFPASSPAESNDDFKTRLLHAENLWQYAGSPLCLLLALYWLGYSNFPMLVQQNGLTFKLNAASGIPNDLTDYSSYLEVGRSNVLATLETIALTFTGGAGAFVSGDKYFLISNTSTSGTMVRHEGSGTGTIAISGVFQGNHSCLVTITGTGSSATATWTLEFDGGPDPFSGPHTGGLTSTSIPRPWWDTDGRLAICSRYIILMTDVPAWWTGITVPPNDQSLPSTSEMNTIWKAADLYGPAKARLLSILIPGTANLWGYPFDKTWGDGGTYGGPNDSTRWGNPFQ